jgi:Outer membrane protein
MKNKFILLSVLCALPFVCFGGTLGLGDYKGLALKNNGDLKQASYQQEAASQTAKYAFTKYFPQVSALGAAVSTDFIKGTSREISTLPNLFGLPSMVNDSHGYVLSAIMATQPVFAGGRIFNSNRLAKTGKDVAEQQYKMERNKVILEAETKYRTLLVLKQKKETLIAYSAMIDALYKQVAQAKERGVVTRTDLLRVELKQAEIKSAMSALDRASVLARKDFNIYAGLPADDQSEVADENEEVTKPAYDLDDLSYRLTLRPEYKLLQDNLKAAKLQREIKTGENLPALSVGAAVERLDFHETGNTYQNSLGFAAVSVPISDWWGGAHNIKETSLKQSSAQEKLDQDSKYLMLDMEKKYKDFQQAYDRVEVARLGAQEAEANESELQDGYKNGTEKLSDFLEAAALKQQSKDKLLEETSSYFNARTAFELAISVI